MTTIAEEIRHAQLRLRNSVGCKDALRRVDELLKQGYAYVVDADLKSYFDTIPHDRLMSRLRERIADGRMLELIESFRKPALWTTERMEPEAGAPQGAVLSPLLSRSSTRSLDHQMAAQGWQSVSRGWLRDPLSQSGQSQRTLGYIRQWCEAEGCGCIQPRRKSSTYSRKALTFWAITS